MHFSSPVDTASGIWDQDLDDIPQNPATLLDLMSVEVVDLLADATHTLPRIIDSIDNEDDISVKAHELLERAKATEANLLCWAEALPSHWYPVRVFKGNIPQEVIDAGVYGDSCDIYPDIMVCTTWNDWRVTRLKVLRLIAKLYSISNLVGGETGTQVISEIQQLVDGICASIPFCLGSRTKPAPVYEAKVVYPGPKGCLKAKEHQKTAIAYGGWYLFVPLKVTMELGEYIRKDQQEWLGLQLARLARMYDVKRASR